MPKHPVRESDFSDLASRRAWLASIAANDNPLPRKAAPTSNPRHGKHAAQLRSLLTWRAASQEADWTSVAVNDNDLDDGGETVPLLLDSTYEIRPRLSEITAAIKDVKLVERRHARLGGGGDPHVVAVGGDVERGPVLSQTKKPQCVIRLGALRLSNGSQAEWAPVRTEAGIQYDWVRIPLGGIVDCKGRKARDKFGAAKGPKQPGFSVSVGSSGRASSGAVAWNDPLAEAQDAACIRASVKAETATILDLALRAANFREIGEHLGHRGRHAERRGREALIAACGELDAALAA
ncbi:MAG: hypothetical protein EOS79_11045 [Mesorhizobium sp.]|nr:MAG: hypothetical protein EOS79_11045 [Mesorhizobium sp.]